MNRYYQPLFGDHNIQTEHFNIFGVNSYNELINLLKDAKIRDEKGYYKLFDMYQTMVTSNIGTALELYDPEIKREFFALPQETFIKQIVDKKLYQNDQYLSYLSNLDYTKIDELTIDHISFLFLERWDEKYKKMSDIIGKISDQIGVLQGNFSDEIIQKKIMQSYIMHFMVFMPKCLAGLSLGNLQRYSKEEYLRLYDTVASEQLKNNDLISYILKDAIIVYKIDEETRNILIGQLEKYQHMIIEKYHELIAYASHGGEIMLNELPDVFMSMIQNEYVMDVLNQSLLT